jgi:hypothetical protein
MTAHVIRNISGTLTEIFQPDTIVGTDGVQHPWDIVNVWSSADLLALGIYLVSDATIPAGKQQVAGSNPTYVMQGDAVVQVVELEDIPVAPVANTSPTPSANTSPTPEANTTPIVITPTPPTLDEAKAAGAIFIDDAAADARKVYVTSIAFQGQTYYMKYLEAQSYQANPTQSLDNLPLLQHDLAVGATAESMGLANTADAVVAGWMQNATTWLLINAVIEAHRVKAKADISAATTIDEVDTIKATFNATA